MVAAAVAAAAVAVVAVVEAAAEAVDVVVVVADVREDSDRLRYRMDQEKKASSPEHWNPAAVCSKCTRTVTDSFEVPSRTISDCVVIRSCQAR